MVDGEHREFEFNWLNCDALAVVTTIAGSNIHGLSEGTGSHATFRYPIGVTLDASGNVFASDYYNQRIRKITSNGGAWMIHVTA